MSSRARLRPMATVENARMGLRAGQTLRGRRGEDFQFLWWPRSWRLSFVRRWPSGIMPIYRWVLRLGPLEIRRWGP